MNADDHTLTPRWPDAAQFWRWSLAVYPKITPLVLQWQDTLNINVNLLLLLLLVQRQQLKLTAEQINLLQHALQAQQQLFTLPLRQLRRQLPAHLSPGAAAQLKQQLLQAELCSEQLEQQQLIDCLQQLPLYPNRHKTSLIALYLQQLHIAPKPLQQQILDLDQVAATVAI